MKDDHPLACLQYREPELFRLYVSAERLHHEDPAASCVKLRAYAEAIVIKVCEKARLPVPKNFADGLETLKSRNRASGEILGWLDELRVIGNRAAHPARAEDSPTATQAIKVLGAAHAVGAWLATAFLGVPQNDVNRFVPPEPAASLLIFRDAIMSRDPEACYQVAMQLLRQENARRDEQLKKFKFATVSYGDAVDFFRKALCKVAAARAQLALLMRAQIAKPSYPEEEQHLLESAAEDGEAEANAELGRRYLHGVDGKTVDLAAALKHLEAAAAQDHPDALNALGKMHYDGLGTPRDHQRATACIRRAAEAGYPLAQCNYGRLLRTSANTEQEQRSAFAWLRRAAEGHCAEAMYEIWRAYRDGDGVELNIEKARSWLLAGADANEPRAAFEMGLAYEFGDGVPSNALKALRMYQRVGIREQEGDKELVAQAKTKMRKMVHRIRRELKDPQRHSDENESNDRVMVHLSCDAVGDPIPDFSNRFAEAITGADISQTPETMLRVMRELNPAAFRDMPPDSVMLGGYLATQRTRKAGPNDPCPCGSGKKRKKCHPKTRQ